MHSSWEGHPLEEATWQDIHTLYGDVPVIVRRYIRTADGLSEEERADMMRVAKGVAVAPVAARRGRKARAPAGRRRGARRSESSSDGESKDGSDDSDYRA